MIVYVVYCYTSHNCFGLQLEKLKENKGGENVGGGLEKFKEKKGGENVGGGWKGKSKRNWRRGNRGGRDRQTNKNHTIVYNYNHN